MNAIVDFVLKHGYAILFAAVFAHQIGIPLPAPLFLLAAGALAATGKLAMVPVLFLAIVATVLADWPWYEAGRRKGMKVLHFIHRLSRDPEFHDRRAKATFSKYGPSILLVSKFVPGLDAVAPPLAGVSHTTRLRFFIFDAIGASLYSVGYVGLGYMFSHNLDRAAVYVGNVGRISAAIVFAALSIYVGRRLLRRLRPASSSHLLTAASTDSPSPACPISQSSRTIEGPGNAH